jgi:hypothetical protein
LRAPDRNLVLLQPRTLGCSSAWEDAPP